jgi:UV DNA damage endonuclease
MESPSPKPEGPRRSTRNRRTEVDSDVTVKDWKEGPPQEQLSNVWNSKENVQRAMRELGEMEEKLQSAVRKQRLAIESSDLSVETEASAEEGIKPNIRLPKRKAVNEKPDGVPDEYERAPLDDSGAETVAGDVAESKLEDKDDIERGAARAPPVNSDVLPLPWCGRLGYVSFPLPPPRDRLY